MPNFAATLADIAAVRIFWADGTTSDLIASQLATPQVAIQAWRALPSTGVEAIVVYLKQTYTTYIDKVLTTRNYRIVMHGWDPRWGGADYYWFNNGQFGAGNAADQQKPSQSNVVKTGTLLPEDQWRPIYERAKESHVAPT
jgi:hypothetical protein